MLQTRLVFDPYSEDFFNDPFDTYRQMRDRAPVYYNEQYDFYALSRHADVAAALRDFRTYSSADGADLEMIRSPEKPFAASVITMDPPDHARMRALVNKLFTPRAIQSRHQLVTKQIGRRLAAVGTEFDVVQDFSALFPVDVIAQMLGVPAEFSPQIRRCVEASLHREPGCIEMTDAGVRAVTQAVTMYAELARQRRETPADDMISVLAAAEIGLSDMEIAMFAATLGGAGAESVTKLIGNAAVTFWRHPEQWQKLLEDRSKIPAAVEELLRHEGPTQYVVRTCTDDVHLHGTTIPAGKPVFLILGSANRDPNAFSHPDAFDIDRSRSQVQPLGLGYGIHSCLGAALARLESTMALEALLDFMPRYHVLEDRLTRVTQINVAGWNTVPVRVLP